MTMLILSVALAQAQFVRTYGGSGGDVVNSLVATPDGGYVSAGGTYSFGAGGYDFFLVKLDSTATPKWARTVGGTSSDAVATGALVQTPDGGYAMAGYTESFGAGARNAFIVKLDSAGAFQWARTVGDTGAWTEAKSLVATPDGGYAMAGYIYGVGAGSYDFLLVKFDGSGNFQWARTFGDTAREVAYALVTTPDSGYVVAGYTDTFGAGVTDMFLVKTDNAGTLQWARAFGGTDVEGVYALVMTPDGGYALASMTYSFGAGGQDILLAKLDSTGAPQWARTFGGALNDNPYALVQTGDGGYAMASRTYSFGAGNADMFLVKTDNAGTLQWARALGDTGNDYSIALVVAPDGGYAAAGYTYGFGSIGSNAIFAKMSGAGDVCIGTFANPTVTSPALTVTDSNPTVTNPSLTVTSPSPTVTSPILVDSLVCYTSIPVAERSPIGATPRLVARLVRGGLSISVTSPTGVAVYAADGRLVRRLTVHGTVRVTLRAGVYVLRDEHGATLTVAVAR